MLINQISVVIIAQNSAETIEESLASLNSFNEVILYLNNSTDHTKEIAETFLNVRIIEGEFIGFGPTKNKASTYATNEWILSLDSDEVLNKALIEEIKAQDFLDKTNLFILKRDNYFLGAKTISKDYIVRIYNTLHTQFNDNLVHEKIIVNKESKQIKLKTSFKHHNITDINQTLTKMIKYTDLGAENKKTCFFVIVILKSLFAFIQTYFLRFYFINGWRGFVIASSNANRRFYKYLKQYINCQKSSE
ncbi:MAG: Putative two-domain glycosyltransferase [uncultured Sulfurovum sp.]|uniref:Two-domain glycosyltransferase n=1 Tax=uncultured Sulfurovum sp. TaxID=269237 RepID=A0A6S6T8L2_9BACT|nr:MAG: Putative two-domain glycosyltransferase [uncultured Sulfurovum sp.]